MGKPWTYQTITLTLTLDIYENPQRDHPGSTYEVKLLSDTWIIPTDELHVKKNRGRPPKVKITDRHADKGIPPRSPQVNDVFSYRDTRFYGTIYV